MQKSSLPNQERNNLEPWNIQYTGYSIYSFLMIISQVSLTPLKTLKSFPCWLEQRTCQHPFIFHIYMSN